MWVLIVLMQINGNIVVQKFHYETEAACLSASAAELGVYPTSLIEDAYCESPKR